MLHAVWMVLGALAVLMVFLPPPATGGSLGWRRFQTPAVEPGMRVAQRFRLDSRDLAAVEIRTAASGEPRGLYELTIRNLDDPGAFRSVAVPAAVLARDDSYTFEFEPFVLVRGNEFELEVRSASDDPGSGVALRATRGTPDEGNVLLFNDAVRWGTLAFRARTSRVSPWQALSRPAPAGRPSGWWGLVGLAGFWVTARFVLLGFASARATDGPSPGEDASADRSGGERDPFRVDERRHGRPVEREVR